MEQPFKRILLIEDEPGIQDLYRQVLTERGYQVTIAGDGQEAIDMLFNQSRQFDLVLLDIMLPHLDGMSILKKIKAPDSPIYSLPVILLTNLSIDQMLKEALNLGAVMYIIKDSQLPDEIADEIDNFFRGIEI